MTWMHFEDDRREQWYVHQDGLWLLCQQYVCAQMINQRAHVVPEKTHWYKIAPHISNVEIDFKNFHLEKVKAAQDLYADLTWSVLRNARNVFGQLAQMKDELELYNTSLGEMKKKVAQDNASSIESHVSFWGHAVTAMKLARDGSATVLLVTSSIATGGAAAGVLGTSMSAGAGLGVTAAGSALKGLATYEDSVTSKGVSWSDSRSVGAGLLQATSTFMVSAIPILPKFGGASSAAISKPVLMLITAPVTASSTFAVGVLKGDSMHKSLANAVISTGMSAVPLGDKLEKLAMPITVTLGVTAQKVASAGLQSAASMAADIAQGKVVDWAMDTKKPDPIFGLTCQLARKYSSEDYICSTALCPASYSPKG